MQNGIGNNKNLHQLFFSQYFTNKIRDAGIQCYLKDEHTVTMDPLLTNAVGGIKLVINKDDSQEVFELLRQFDEEYRRNAVCPKCGSHNIELVPEQTPANMITAILSWLFSSYAVSVENVYKCGNCGYESLLYRNPCKQVMTFLNRVA